MRKLWLMLVCAFAVLVLAACSSGSNEEQGTNSNGTSKQGTEKAEVTGIDGIEITEPVEIEFWHAMSGDHEKALQKITDDFNNSHENITVKLVNQGGYGDLSTKVMAAAKANTLPALTQAYEDWMTEYIENDFITNLNPYVESEKYGFTDDEFNDIMEVFREMNTWDGVLYGLPFNKSTQLMFYNVTYFEEAGLEVPTTWDEMKEAAEILTNDDVIAIGFENGLSIGFNQWVHQAGGQFFDEATGEFKMNSEEGKYALTYVNDLIQSGVARTAGEDGYMSGPFARGDVAMYFGSSAGLPYVAAPAAENGIEWSTAVLPSDAQSAAPFAGTNVTMFNHLSDEEKLAAWQYMKFLINTDNTIYWAQQSGYIPVRQSALDSDEWKSYVEENPTYGVAQQQLEYGFYDPRVKGAYAFKNAVAKELDKVFLGEYTVEEGLEAADKAAAKELGK
ncbi:ABC transporter substrate-binding protein [Ureibacillus acetophenoni]|uniref:Carbohydrate ABC transporter substrate-binding protein (CUT1 family) n=1 Tax=Ureibacillus acetophenoni TaxID=614649 RepID=A0A285US08_9BACL|nr:ABC transporter substrate-binding protein [Ureibacillus acetophenoni]SOC44612.1 carbohydrate ABC transporter substrate-binding protein (CUT1 family) [Ureibacillus acetophenoni]